MKKVLGFLSLVICIAGCTKSGDSDTSIAGTYMGTYTRYLGDSSYTSNVTFVFLSNVFSGSTTGDFPLICPGTFQATADSILFNNPCVLPANIQEAFMLTGNYKLRVSGDSVIFSRLMGDFVYEEDFYRLKKQ
jgi:hypothetical protein